MKLPKMTFWRGVFLVVMAAGLYSTYVRFVHGLGDSTNLTNATPWGLWIGFDVLCGVALAGGGFTVTAMVYLFNLKTFKPITRPAILTAWLGYNLVVFALLFDLGRPLRLWHPLVMGNPHSIMFEVSLCVTFYTTVLTLEFAPCVLEPLGWKKLCSVIEKVKIPLVVFGVMLSLMHQSSLGSLYLIAPGKLHPFWYTGALPVLFFFTAVMVGCAMVIVEAFWSARGLGHPVNLPVLNQMGRILMLLLAIYAFIIAQIQIGKGNLSLLLQGGQEAWMFALEVICGILIPLVLLANTRVRRSPQGLFTAAFLVVLGVILNRLNVALTGFVASSGEAYFPSFYEISITLMIVALGILAFNLCARYLNVFTEHGSGHAHGGRQAQRPAPGWLAHHTTLQ